MLFGSRFLEDFWHEVEEHAAISWFDHCSIFPGFQYLVGCLLIGTKTYHIQIWNLSGNPVLLHVRRKYLKINIS